MIFFLVLLSVFALMPAITTTLDGGLPMRAASDAMGLFGPWRHFTAQSFSEGLLPLWNPHTFCGMPFLSNLQTSVFYPPNVVYWVFDFRIALLLDALFHHVLLLTGAYVLARALHLSRSSSFIVAIAWGLSGSVSAHTYVGHTTWQAARAFMPWLLWATLLFLRTEKKRYIAGFCLLLVMQNAAGYPPISMLSLALCGGLWLAREVSSIRRPAHDSAVLLEEHAVHKSSTRSGEHSQINRRRLLVAAPFLLISALLLCAWALPFIELNRASVHGTTLPYAEASRLSGTWRSLMRLFLPFYFGDNHVQWSVRLSGAYEQNGYCGLYATALALCAPLVFWRLKSQKAASLILSPACNTAMRAIPWLYLLLPVSILLSLGSEIPLHRWLYDHTLLFKQLRVPGRWIELWVVAVPLLAGFTNQHLIIPLLQRRSQSTGSDSHDTSENGTSGNHSEVKADALVNDRWDHNLTGIDGLKIISGVMGLIFVLSGIALLYTLLTPPSIWVERVHFSLKDLKITPSQTASAAEIFTQMALESCVLAMLLSGSAYFALRALRPGGGLKLITPRRAYLGLLAILLFDMMSLFWNSASTTSRSEYSKLSWPQPLQAQYRFPDRWFSMGYWADSNIHMMANADVMNGYDPAMSKDFFSLSVAVDKGRNSNYNDWFVARRNSPFFKIAGVTHSAWRKGARQDESSPSMVLPPQQVGQWFVARQRESWPRFYLSRHLVEVPVSRQLAVLRRFSESDFARLQQPVVVEKTLNIQPSPLVSADRVLDVKRTINTLTLNVNATAPSLLTVADANFAGWRVWVNGQPATMQKANYLFRGVEVPSGRSKVVMAYDSQTFRFAVFASLCGVLLGSIWTASFLFRKLASTIG